MNFNWCFVQYSKSYPCQMASYSRFRFSAQDSQISNSTLQLQLKSPTPTLVNVANVEMLPKPIPIPNWKVATLELYIFTLATFTTLQLKHPNTQKPQPRMRMFRNEFSFLQTMTFSHPLQYNHVHSLQTVDFLSCFFVMHLEAFWTPIMQL